MSLYRRGKLLRERVTNLESTILAVAASATLSKEVHANRALLLGAAALVTLTLPAATGTGVEFEFVVGTVNTSNYVIKVANATDVMVGSVLMLADAGDTTVGFEAAGTSDTITLNGTTQGGAAVGDRLILKDIAAGKWLVQDARLTGTGSEATPFSATVS